MKHEKTISHEHLLYLRGLRNKTILINVIRISMLAIFLILWELSAYFAWINPFITSSPSRIAKTIAQLYKNGTLFHHVGTTLWETLAGFSIAVLLGYGIALLLWWSNILRRISEPYFVVLNALPKIALGPLIIIWGGTGSKAIVFMTVLIPQFRKQTPRVLTGTAFLMAQIGSTSQELLPLSVGIWSRYVLRLVKRQSQGE